MKERAWREVCALKAQQKPNVGKQQASGQPDMSTLSRDGRITYLYKDLARWEVFFSTHLQILMDALNHFAATETVVLLSLCARLSTVNQGTEYVGLRKDGVHGGANTSIA